MAGFLGVLVRGLALSGQALALGGIVFAFLVGRPLAPGGLGWSLPLSRSLGLVTAGALGLALAQCLSFVVQVGSLAGDTGWPLRELAATTYFRAGLGRLVSCLGLVVGCRALGARPRARGWWGAVFGFGLGLVLTSAWMSHAAARLEHRGLLLALDALHQLAAAVWVGGLVHLAAAAAGGGERPWPGVVLQRFSALALGAVATLVAAGLGLSLFYIDGVGALVGTAYGFMVLTKAVVLVGLLVLGALNFLAVRGLGRSPEAPVRRLRRFVEVEVGLGITVLFAAASLTSLPPAVDVVADRAGLAEVGVRFTPQWPTLQSPAIEELPVSDPDAPRTAADRAWSEYNHHMAGLFVLAMGLLAILYGSGRAPWARHWPLLFLGLAAFLLVRNDPGAWPLGPRGFWESLTSPAVFQHRLFVLLVVVFGIFEWMVRTGRLGSPGWALLFPVLCAVGGGLLLTHSHALLNLKEEFLVEVTHAPLGVLGMFVGWTRWLELRLPAPEDRLPGRFWAIGLVLVGLLLLLYRES